MHIHTYDPVPHISACMQAVCDIWNQFSARFLELWNTEADPDSLSCSAIFASDPGSLTAAQTAFMRQLLADSLRFGGCVMIRRLLGIAHNADFERIEDVEVKATCEIRALRVGRELLVNCDQFATIEEVVELARKEQGDGVQPCFPMAAAAEE